MEETIDAILQKYGSQLLLTFASLVITTFVLATMKDLVFDIINYIKARFSDVGYGQRIVWRDNQYTVQKIEFKHIIVCDDVHVIRIPIKDYMNGPIIFPRPRDEWRRESDNRSKDHPTLLR